jgi:hypothetical protein
MKLNSRVRIPNITVRPIVIVINEDDMEEHCIRTELPEYAEDYQVEMVDGLHIVVLGTIDVNDATYHVIDVEPERSGEDNVYILSLVRSE